MGVGAVGRPTDGKAMSFELDSNCRLTAENAAVEQLCGTIRRARASNDAPDTRRIGADGKSYPALLVSRVQTKTASVGCGSVGSRPRLR